MNGTFPIFSPGHLANATTDLMKLDHEEEPQLSEPYLSKQKKLMVSAPLFVDEEYSMNKCFSGGLFGSWSIVND